MLKTITRLTLAALAASLFARAVAAQVPATQTPAPATWVAVAPEGDNFAVLMSTQPSESEQSAQAGGLYVTGRRYAAAADAETNYFVWSLRDVRGIRGRLQGSDTIAEGVTPEALYLDRIAEVAWELLIAPELERLKREHTEQDEKVVNVGMKYTRTFWLDGHQAREYFVNLEKARGLVYVCGGDGERVYVVAGLGASATDPRLKIFVDSLAVGTSAPHAPAANTLLIKPDPRKIPYGLPNSTAPEPSSGPGRGGGMGVGDGTGIGPGRGSNTGGGGDRRSEGGGGPGGSGSAPDYSRTFKQAEVTRKAIITLKPEPGFTEEARKFTVTGVVRLRATLTSSGEVTNVVVYKSLPHGLTRKAMDAAKQVRFTPAQKDGRNVSQYVIFEYNFNIY